MASSHRPATGTEAPATGLSSGGSGGRARLAGGPAPQEPGVVEETQQAQRQCTEAGTHCALSGRLGCHLGLGKPSWPAALGVRNDAKCQEPKHHRRKTSRATKTADSEPLAQGPRLLAGARPPSAPATTSGELCKSQAGQGAHSPERKRVNLASAGDKTRLPSCASRVCHTSPTRTPAGREAWRAPGATVDGRPSSWGSAGHRRGPCGLGHRAWRMGTR